MKPLRGMRDRLVEHRYVPTAVCLSVVSLFLVTASSLPFSPSPSLQI